MNWIFESRSKNWYDEDSDGEIYGSPVKWYEILLIPVTAVVLMLLGTLGLLFVFGYGFYEIAQKSYGKGGLESPCLTMVGIFLTVILWVAHNRSGFEFSHHPFLTYWSLIFIIPFTLAPLTGPVWRLFKQKPAFLKYHRCLIISPGCHFRTKDEESIDFAPQRHSPALAGGTSICLANRGAQHHCPRRARGVRGVFQ
jgi:hypothetical protein